MYPFHPRHGETVLVRTRFTYRGTEVVAIAQPDGTLTCIPEWMTRESASRIKLAAEPHFSLEDLRSLRVEIDRLLEFLAALAPVPACRRPPGCSAPRSRSERLLR